MKSALDASTEELNKTLTEAESVIKGIKLGVVAEIPLMEFTEVLGHLSYQKYEGKEWRLVFAGPTEAMPLVSATRRVRIIAVKALPSLITEMVKAAGLELERVRDAVSQVQEFINVIRSYTK